MVDPRLDCADVIDGLDARYGFQAAASESLAAYSDARHRHFYVLYFGCVLCAHRRVADMGQQYGAERYNFFGRRGLTPW